MRVFSGVCGAAVLALGAGAAALPAAQEPSGPSLGDGVYTSAQADRGEALYDEQCAVCHGAIRAFVPEMAALLGDHTFRNTWRGRTVGELFAYVRETMPQDAPGTLTAARTAEIIAHILRGNRRPAGEADLPVDEETLNGIPFDW